jgi:hypothetical protein
MQLILRASGTRAPSGGAFADARTLLTLCLIGAPALAGVLPEDRADVLYHRYEGGGITIQGPSVLVRKKVGDNFSFSANYYEDMISSASIDVKLSASPYHEKRTQKSFQVDYLHGKTTYSAGIINSKEPDYKSNTSYYSISQDMFGDLTTVTMSYRRGWDRVYSDVKVNGVIQNDPNFGGVNIPFRIADHRGYALGLTQILTRNMILGLNYEALTDEGFLASPYRKIRYVDPTKAVGFTLADQIYPGTRTSNAASAELKYFLPYRAALSARYRFFRDTWGIVAHTAELDYTHPVWKHWIFDGSVRYYRQGAADFYSDLFPRANYSNFMARDRELASFNSYTLGLGAAYEFSVPRAPWINKSSLNIHYDRLMIHYADFRNALFAGQNGFTAGNEPLYNLDANIFQVFVSIWF